MGKDGEFLPSNRGFDHYYGVPYGIDMCSQATATALRAPRPVFSPDCRLLLLLLRHLSSVLLRVGDVTI